MGPTHGALLSSFLRHVQDRRHELAIWSRGEKRSCTFGELAADVDDWRARLVGLRSPTVAVATGNSIAFCAITLALIDLRRPLVLLDGSLDEDRKVELCRLLGVPCLLHLGTAGRELGDGVRHFAPEGVESSEPPAGTAVVKLTSGTTGDPVGVCLSEEALTHGIAQIAGGMQIDARERVLVAIPLSHSYGFDNGVLSLAMIGTPLVLEPSYFPHTLLKALAESEATFFPTAPPLIGSLGQVEWPRGLALRRVISAGGPLPARAADRFHSASGIRVNQFYGSTETGGICFERAPDEDEAVGTVGHPLPGVDVRLTDDARIEVRSAANFGAHLGRDTSLTTRVVVTGDSGAWTESGRLRLTGRTAEVVNVGGRKVPVLRVERALRDLAGIEDVAVVGVADPVRGEKMVAFFVGPREDVDLSQLPSDLVPRQMRRVTALPYTDRGKVDRQRLRRWASE